MVHVIKGFVAVVQTIFDYVHLQILAKMNQFQEHQHNVSTVWFTQPTYSEDFWNWFDSPPCAPCIVSVGWGQQKQCHLMLFLVP